MSVILRLEETIGSQSGAGFRILVKRKTLSLDLKKKLERWKQETIRVQVCPSFPEPARCSRHNRVNGRGVVM